MDAYLVPALQVYAFVVLVEDQEIAIFVVSPVVNVVMVLDGVDKISTEIVVYWTSVEDRDVVKSGLSLVALVVIVLYSGC